MSLDSKHIERTIDISVAEELIKSVDAIKIIDVRTPAEYESVHIPGSYNVPLDQLPEHRVELARKLHSPIILVCRSGARAEQAAKLFEATHLKQFHVLRGGIQAWEQAGKPMKLGKERWSMERQVRGLAGALVVLSVLGSWLVWQPLALIAGFIGAGLAYSALTNTCGMAILLSKLPYNRIATCDVCEVVRQLSCAE
jgi:rhodanese-related sulfurtransferase